MKFQIGSYKDKVVCDIMPMDVCHILLGRAWQYDKNVVHDGQRNTYAFEMDRENHTLIPLKAESAAIEIGIKC